MPKPLSYPLRSSELISPDWKQIAKSRGNARPGYGDEAIAEGVREELSQIIRKNMLSDINEEDIDTNTDIHVFGLSSNSSKPPSTRGMLASAAGDHIPSSPPVTSDNHAEEPIRGRISHDNMIAKFEITIRQKRLSSRQICRLPSAFLSLFLSSFANASLVMPSASKSLTRKSLS